MGLPVFEEIIIEPAMVNLQQSLARNHSDRARDRKSQRWLHLAFWKADKHSCRWSHLSRNILH